jgi:hypothetical protein
MAKIQRNGPCPCGSGNKAKRCCYAPQKELRAIPGDLCHQAISDLVGTERIEMNALFDELVYLPEIDISLQVRMPGILTPEIDRAVDALRTDDGEEFDEALSEVVRMVDNVDRRLELAHAVVRLRDDGHIPSRLAALAILELDREYSALFHSSVAQSLAVLAGEERTPTGLLVAAR